MLVWHFTYYLSFEMIPVCWFTILGGYTCSSQRILLLSSRQCIEMCLKFLNDFSSCNNRTWLSSNRYRNSCNSNYLQVTSAYCSCKYHWWTFYVIFFPRVTLNVLDSIFYVSKYLEHWRIVLFFSFKWDQLFEWDDDGFFYVYMFFEIFSPEVISGFFIV